MNVRGCVEQLTAAVAEPSPSSNDSAVFSEAALESDCTLCHVAELAEASSPPFAVVGDSISEAACDGSDCTITQCVQNSEAGAGEVGTVVTEEPPVTVPQASPDCTGSDTTSLLSTSTDSKSVPDVSPTAEQTALTDSHLTLSRKLSSSRERPQAESTVKPTRPQRMANETVQKPCELLPQMLVFSLVHNMTLVGRR